jgi:dienelactone hydrolase
MKTYSYLLLIALLFSVLPGTAQDDVNLFGYWKFYSDVENTQYKYFCNEAFGLIEKREAEIATLKTKDDWIKRQKKVRSTLTRIVGKFPEKTPLNARVTGVLQRDGYRVEKLIYESLPGYYVPAALFIPDNLKGKAPAILNAIGHSTASFRRDLYQHVIINFVKKGFVVLTYDQIGQGERLQYYDETTGKSKYPSTTEHSYPGAQCFITGYSPARYFIWDGIRGIDYLLSRPEVDPDRIGMTGLSGGGTSTTFVGAFDDRIVATAPTCFVTNYKSLFKSIGPQDAEQNIYHLLSAGLDHPDFMEVRAPKPTLMVTTTRDFFSIDGARETFAEAKKAYRAFGDETLLQMTEGDRGHGFIKNNNEAMFAFFQKYLNNPGSPSDEDVELIPAEDLQITKTGQLATSLKGETIFTLNKKVVEQKLERFREVRSEYKNSPAKVVEIAKDVSGFEKPEEFGRPVFSGRYVNETYKLEKYLVDGSGGYKLPVALYLPVQNRKDEVVLLLDEAGMEHAANQNELAHQLVGLGYQVVLFDVPGIGCMGPGYLRGDAYIGKVSFNQWFSAILVGKSIVGLRAEDILRVVHFAKQLDGVKTVSAIARGLTTSEMLHAAAFCNDIKKVALLDPLMSYTDITLTRGYNPKFILNVVPGSVGEYDLPDLMAALKGRKLLLNNPLKADGNVASKKEYSEMLAFPVEVWRADNSLNDFIIVQQKEDKLMETIAEKLLK